MRGTRKHFDPRRTQSWLGSASPYTYRVLIFSIGLATGLGGCVLAPHGTREEKMRLTTASAPFEPRIETRQIPELPTLATWQDVLSRAFLANGDLESS
jgi:hypothetical protein